MAKFRKKPVEVEAYQTDKEIDIKTLEGTMHANVEDWIITGVNGEQYPCKPDIFVKTYEPVSDEHQAVDNKGKFNAHETLIGKALDAGHIYR